MTGILIEYLSRTVPAKATPNNPSERASISSPPTKTGLWFNKRSNIAVSHCGSISVSNLERANKDRVPLVVRNARFSLPFAKAIDRVNDTHVDRRDWSPSPDKREFSTPCDDNLNAVTEARRGSPTSASRQF
jgi:hypothetical protein